MNPPLPDKDELLSGMLDGELSGSDARRIENAMREEPALQGRLDELSAIRSSLLRGRPTGRLPKSFAANVVAAAQQRAVSMGEAAPDWISIPEASRPFGSGSKPKLDPPFRQRLLIPLGALASACAIALIAFFALPKQEPQQFAELPPFSDSPGVLGNSFESDAFASNPSIEETTSEKKVDGTQPTAPILEPPSEQPRKELASADKKVADDADPLKSSTNESSGLQPSKVLDTSAMASATPSSQPNDASVASVGLENKDSATNRLPFMLMVVTVSMDKVARENNALNRILNEHGIASIEDLSLNSDQLDALLSTGMAGSVSQSGAGVYFLKGYAKSLAGALDDICSQYKDFPEFGLNIAMDDSARALVDQLDGIQVAANKGVAKRLGAKTPNGLVSRFASGAKRAAPVSGKMREEFRFEATMPKSDLNPISHLLLIVRDAD